MPLLAALVAALALFALADVFPGCGGGPPPRPDSPSDTPAEQ